MSRIFVRHILLTLLLGGLLTACGGGGTALMTTDDGSSSENSIELAWVAPSSRSDGSYLALSELAGFRIYYGTSADNLSPLVDINDAFATQILLSDLPAGTYYFALTAYDVNGEESGLSGIVTRTIG